MPLAPAGLPSSPVSVCWYQDLDRWLPGAGALSPIARSTLPVSGHLFPAWGEFAVFSCHTVVLLALGAWSFARRDV